MRPVIARRRFLGGALGLPLCLQLGCAANKVSLREGPREYVATDYDDVREKWTRKGDLITLSQLDNLLETTATYESWDFRWSYVVRYVEDYRLTVDQRAKLLDKTLAETQTGHHFFVAITGGEHRYNDLTKPDSAWIVRLIDSTGNEIAPDEIVAIKRPNTIERTYYPYVTVFHQVFRIRFPRSTPEGKPAIANNADWFGLRFAGALGSSELTWEIDRDAPSPTSPAGSSAAASTQPSAAAPPASVAPPASAAPSEPAKK